MGSAEGARTRSFAWGADGRLAGLTDAVGRTTTFARDALGRATSELLPGGRTLGLAYDAVGNLAAVTPPSRGAHTLEWSPVDLLAGVTPPPVDGAGTRTTTYAHDADRNRTGAGLPDGDVVVQAWADPAGGLIGTDGQLASTASAAGTARFGWDAAGRLASATADGVTFSVAYDGALVTSQSWTGAVAGVVTAAFDAQHRPVSLTVAGVPTALAYDADGLLTGAGALSVTRDAASGLPVATGLGAVATVEGWSPLGEPATSAASAGATALYGVSLTRDALGRITGVAETVQGVSRTVGYGYDTAGRLAAVTVDGSLAAAYGYDPQGNRTSLATGGITVGATFDAQDRLLTAGSNTYGWTPTGTLASRSGAAGATTFQHDAQGRLRGAVLPDGRRLDYLLDGLGRRVGKRVDGLLAEGFLFDGERPVAWLDGAGGVIAVFVYGPRGHAPEYLVSGAATYRIVADHLGSPRLVVDAATGAVVQRLDYDAFGEVLLDSNPGFQPFGFAGGLRDLDTGLTHFGARDYDPATGRWTSKDPLGFAAGDGNLYAYAGNDPVNRIDPSGLAEVCAARRHVRPGDTLFINAADTTLLEWASAGSRPLKRFQPGTTVTFRGIDPADSRFIQVEQGGQAGYMLRQDLSNQHFGTEVLPGIPVVGRPLDAHAYPSYGAGTKG
ncbi:MAG: RHS repeat-associated core domain-containing protein [Anaeromyxobacter sp.]|nr:RHS repeat-associated core domain-containing protein [Anaeromyxobacter sp.]